MSSSSTSASSLELLQSNHVENAEVFASDFDAKRALADRAAHDKTPSVLFICHQNAGRSQLAEALFNRRLEELGKTQKDVATFSAGAHPGKALNPVVKESLQEIGVNTSHLYPKPISTEFASAASLVITMGCDEGSCPAIQGKKNVVAWDLPDAKGKDLAGIREIRSSVGKLVDDLIEQMGLDDGKKQQ